MFNKNKDLSPVDQVGFLNLADVYTSGVIPGDFNFTDEEYNRASPDDLMHRPDDVFAGYRQREFVRSSLSAQAKTEQVTS